MKSFALACLMAASSLAIDLESSKIFVISTPTEDKEEEMTAVDLAENEAEEVEVVLLEPVDLQAAESDETTVEAEVIIKEVEAGFDELEEENEEAEEKEVEQVAAKVDELEGAIITIAKVETKDVLEKEAPEEPV